MKEAAIVDRLLAGWHGGVLDDSDLPSDLSLDDGLALQLQLLGRLEAEGEQLGGWKVGLTSGTALDRMGPGFRPFGFLLASRIIASGETVTREAGLDGVEGELCVRLGAALRGEVTPAEARTAVCAPGGAVLAGLELGAKGRYTGTSAALQIASNMTNWGIVVGEGISPVPADTDLDGLEVWLEQDGAEIARQAAAGHIDDHFLSLSRLARQLSRFDRGLVAGQRVITGAFVRSGLHGPTQVAAEFGGIGRVAVSIR